MIVGEERLEKKTLKNMTSRATRNTSILGGQDKKKADSKSTGLTGSSGGLSGPTGVTSPVNPRVPARAK